MAEAVCGPSNALHQFKQQTDVDRTLQQDRLASRQHPAQGFRSPNPYAGALDPEFEAFQAGHAFPLQDNALQFQSPAGFGCPAQAQAPSPSWAADFQRMHISQPPPLQQSQFQPAPNSSDWAHGFREHLVKSAPRAQNSSPSPQAFQQRARYGLTGFQSQFSQPIQPSYAPAVQSKGKAPVTEQFDEAAFAAAFDQARDDLMAETETVDAEDMVQEEVPTAQELIDEVNAEKFEALVEEAATQMLREPGHDMDIEEYTPLARLHTGTDIEHEPMQTLPQEEQVEQKPNHDDDALAATAEELLQKVKHNQSDKFKNSQFLGLMRKLRDREVRVEGDKMVETERSSSTTAADTTLNASSNANLSERVYYGKPQPAPLPVDTRPPEYGIPHGEQDNDLGRIDPRDGQEVVDLLNERTHLTEDIANPNDSVSEMLYGPNGSLSMQTAPFGGI